MTDRPDGLPPDPLEPDLDRILRRSLEETASRLPIPTPEPTWAAICGTLAAEARRRRRARLRTATAATAAALLLTLAVSPDTRGWNPWAVIHRFFAGPDGTGMVQFGSRPDTDESGAGRTPPPPSAPAEGYREIPLEAAVDVIPVPPPEELSLAEAARRAPFPVRFPEWLPEGTEVLRVTYRPPATEGGAAEVIVQLGGPRGGDLEISQSGPIEQFGSGHAFDRANTRVRRVEVDGTEGILLDFLRNGSSSLEWFSGGVLYRIRSDGEGDATLRIARSLRAVPTP